MNRAKKTELTYVDLFSGAGGFSLGFEKLGFKNVFSIDNNKEFCRTYSHNFPKHNLIIDKIENLTDNIIDKLCKKKVTAVIGGPPCQGFSIAGKIGRKFIKDERNYLFREFVRVSKKIKPKFIVMENVARLYTHNKGKTRLEIIREFEKIGYYMECKVLNASDFGIPQHRRRVFFIGKKMPRNYEYFLKPNVFLKFPDKDTSNLKTIKDAISDLPSLKSGSYNLKFKNHIAMNHTEKMLEKMSFLKDGGNRNQMPENLMPNSGDVRKYIKYKSNEPSICITGDMRKVFHYKDNRALTVRELARIQTFPDWFEFKSTSISQQQQIGNAVPPLLAERIAQCILDMFNE